MRSIRPIRTGVLGAALVAFAVAAPLAAPLVGTPSDRVLKDKDVKKLSAKLADWFTALEEGSGKIEAEEDVREELTKINLKKFKGDDLLAHPEDLGAVFYLANRYDKKQPRRGAGKVVSKTDEIGRGTVEYAVWSPAKYRPKSGPYTLIITIPDEGENPEKHLKTNWTDGGLLETTIIASPKMPGDSKQWTENEGLAAVLLTFRQVSETYAIDFDRVFLGGRGRGGETAVAIANMFPSRWAGTFSWASDAGENIPPENLQHMPVFISGGGAKATAYEARAKEAGIENVTIDSGGGQPEIIAWMENLHRVKYPDKITLIPGARFPTGAYWLQIKQVADPEGVRIDVEINRETNTITLVGSGISQATVYFSDAMVDLSKPVTVIANGVKKVEQFERSFRTVLELLEAAKVDPGRVFVAAQKYHLAAPTEEAGD